MFGCCALVFGMMLGAVPTSIPQFIVVINWILEGNFKTKWQRLKSSKVFWILLLVFLIHVIGVIYSHNLKDALQDLQIKVPLLLLPVVFFSTKPPSLKELHFIIYSFLVGCVVNTIWCFMYSFMLHQTDTIRNVSRFMSHIRFGMYLNMAICCCVYFCIKLKDILQKITFLMLGFYFVFTLYALGLASGFFNLIVLAFIFGLIFIFKQQLKFKLIAFVILTASAFLLLNYVKGIYNSQYTLNKSESSKKLTQNSIDELSQMENGNFVFMNVKNNELQQQWQKHFYADSFNFAPQFHNINRYYVLLRYLTSKGLTKDSVGVSKLNPEDLNAIKNNTTNYLYPNWGYLHKRIYELVNEYDELKHHRNVNGHSLTMRLYFWKAAFEIIKNNPIIGVGTGDVQDELNYTYTKINSPLTEEWQKRPHNQFITITVAFGFVGLIIFLMSLFYPLIKLRKQLFVLYFPFFILLISSFILEDTLESQAGMAFYVTFNSLFLSFNNNWSIAKN